MRECVVIVYLTRLALSIAHQSFVLVNWLSGAGNGGGPEEIIALKFLLNGYFHKYKKRTIVEALRRQLVASITFA